MEGTEHELHKMEWHLTRWTTQCLGKNWKNGMKRTDERTTTSTMNEFDSILKGRAGQSCWGIEQQKNKLVVDLSKTSQNMRWNYATTKCLNIWEQRRNAKLHFRRKWRIICTSRHEKKRYLNSSNKNLDENLKEWNKSWRTPMKNPGDKRIMR